MATTEEIKGVIMLNEAIERWGKYLTHPTRALFNSVHEKMLYIYCEDVIEESKDIYVRGAGIKGRKIVAIIEGELMEGKRTAIKPREAPKIDEASILTTLNSFLNCVL